MWDIKEQRLRTMNALMKASAEFVQNNVLVKSVDKTPPEDQPETEQRERDNPGNPSAPRARKIGTPFSTQLIKNEWRENERPNDWTLNEHSPGQHCEKTDSFGRRARSSTAGIF